MRPFTRGHEMATSGPCFACTRGTRLTSSTTRARPRIRHGSSRHVMVYLRRQVPRACHQRYRPTSRQNHRNRGSWFGRAFPWLCAKAGALVPDARKLWRRRTDELRLAESKPDPLAHLGRPLPSLWVRLWMRKHVPAPHSQPRGSGSLKRSGHPLEPPFVGSRLPLRALRQEGGT
jgi:hypothetical protein